MQGIHYGTPQANSLHLIKYYFEKYPEYVFSESLSPLLSLVMSPETCLGAIHSSDLLQGSPILLEKARLTPKRDVSKVVLSIKGAYDIKTGPNGSPDGIRASVEKAVELLSGIKTVDILNVREATPTSPSKPRSRP